MSFRAGEKLFLAFFLNLYYTVEVPAGVLELVDEVDSKSIASDGVRVRVPPPVPNNHRQMFCFDGGCFILSIILRLKVVK